MPDRFSNALLIALNESAALKESDWNFIAALLRPRVAPCRDPGDGSCLRVG